MSELEIERALRAEIEDGEEGRLPDIGGPALNSGLVDVAFTVEDSPLGRLLLAATDRGLVRVSYLDAELGDADTVLSDLSARISPRVLNAPARLDRERRELDEFFTGRRRTFDVPVDLRLAGDFGRRVLQATAQIPYGTVSSYGAVAERAGNPRAYRAAGTALGRNPLPIVIPCHRVLHADGGLSFYTGGIERKIKLLEIEGILL